MRVASKSPSADCIENNYPLDKRIILQSFKRHSTSFLGGRKETGDVVAREQKRESKRERTAGGSSTIREGGRRLARMVVIGFGSTSGSPAQSQSPIQPVGCSQSVPEEQLRSRGRALSRLGSPPGEQIDFSTFCLPEISTAAASSAHVPRRDTRSSVRLGGSSEWLVART